MNQEQTQQLNMIDTAMAVLTMPISKAHWASTSILNSTVTGLITNMGILNNVFSMRMLDNMDYVAQTKAFMVYVLQVFDTDFTLVATT
jgi:hypothetical protein